MTKALNLYLITKCDNTGQFSMESKNKYEGKSNVLAISSIVNSFA